MYDWQDKVARPHLTCFATQAPIGYGETFFSVLRFQNGHFVRHDYSESAWEESPPQDYLSWWRQRRPVPANAQEQGPRLVSPNVLLGIFRDLKDRGERPNQCLAWMLALLLLRAKKLRYHDIRFEEGHSWLWVQERGGKTAYRIRDPQMNSSEHGLLQESMLQLFDQAPGETTPEAAAAEETPASDLAEG